MPPPRPNLELYLATDSVNLPFNSTVYSQVEACLSAKHPPTIVQLREKHLSTAKFIELARDIYALTSKHGVPLLINDRVDVALAVGCEGVHLGWDDMDVPTARKLLGPEKIIGLSVSNHEQLEKALGLDPTYLGIGPVFSTPTKPDHNPPLGTSGVRSLLSAIPITMQAVAIGGINHGNVQRVLFQSKDISGRRLDGVAVVSAIMASPLPVGACNLLHETINWPPLFVPTDYSLRTEDFPIYRDNIHKHKPLVHHITNNVVKSISANISLAIGASPIMSENPAEFADLAALPNVGCVLNMGTFASSRESQDLFLGALREHNVRGNPVIFDPVGAGATNARREFAQMIVGAGYCTVIKGNEGEIRSLAGLETAKMRGVDGAGEGGSEEELAKVVHDLASLENNIVLMTGPKDYISNGARTFCLTNGSAYQSRVTGIGCALGSVIAAFCAAAPVDESLIGPVISAIGMYNIAAERADKLMESGDQPGKWAAAFVDCLAAMAMSDENLTELISVHEVEELANLEKWGRPTGREGLKQGEDLTEA
ncbi:Hydroxyethylthiazole kinase family-domain-containing protein [Tuber indicum]|nr:Hydroxyethylthiazole kinase family-domain-containing protein [Tuber indicum]